MTNTTTDATCSEACWKAKQPECSCSCGGANHGCLLLPGGQGERPARTRRIAGVRYELRSIGWFSELSQERYRLNAEAYSRYVAAGGRRRPADAAVLERATKEQLKWPEIAAVAEGHHGRPALLWVQLEEVPA